jgi:hypothetical protein
MTREELANWLCDNVRRRRLHRIGEPYDHLRTLDDLPVDERQNWMDMADAVRELLVNDERLDVVEGVARLIVELDASDLPVGQREVLIGHLTGGLFVATLP